MTTIYFLGSRSFLLVSKFWIAAIRNNTEITFSPKCNWHYCSYWWITKNRLYVLWCCVPPVLVVQINNFFSLLLFSAVNHKRGGMKLISKRIKYKLDSSWRMYFAFFILKTFKTFLENYQFSQKSENETNSSRRWGEGVMFFASL